MVVWRWWNLLFANNDTSWRKNSLILFLYIWFTKLLQSKWWMINNGLNLWNHGRLQKNGKFSSQKLNSCMYILLCDAPYINSVNDVGDMSNEQRQPRQCYVTSNYRVPELHGLCWKYCKLPMLMCSTSIIFYIP